MFTKDRFSENKYLCTPLKLIGGKTSSRDLLYQFFPEHKIYVEPFIGTLTVLMGKEISDNEIASDINPYVIDFFNVLKSDPEAFWAQMLDNWERLKRDPKPEFEKFKYYVTRSGSPISRSVYFYLITKHCFNGIWRINKQGECNSSWGGTVKGRGILTREWFMQVRERIKNVQFEVLDYRTALVRSIPGSFTYLDSPYFENKTIYNGVRWKKEDFIDYRNVLDEVEGKWLLSLNDDPFIRELFKNYEMVSHDIHYSCSQTNSGRGKHPELLIANYDILTKARELKLLC